MLRFCRTIVNVHALHRYRPSPSFAHDFLVRTSSAVAVESVRDGTLQFCVVGSGPAGFYTASQLLKSFQDKVRVSILERLPTPFGLVRSGVAPDHPETKNVINQFSQLGGDPRVSFFGNVNVGQDIALSSLRDLYDGVILAYGAESNRTLDIEGRHSEGIFTAREFVWWYNGHPECSSLPIDLSKITRVSVLGLGNVALDCARILLQPPTRLQSTDIASHALEQLHRSAVQQVDIVGRRGPAQAAFTAKELREVLNLEGIDVVMPKEDMVIKEADEVELKLSRSRKRVFDLLTKASEKQPQIDRERKLRMRFFRSPVAVLSDELGRVSGVRLGMTKLQRQGDKQIAVTSEETEDIPADLVLESIGYRSLPISGAPFDEKQGHIPNRSGRVLAAPGSDAVDVGLYVCGWAKRGPSGIIGTNLTDAAETVRAICEDVQYRNMPHRASPGNAAETLRMELDEKGVKVVTFQNWLKIDEAEKSAGEAEKRDRVKFVSVPEMLEVA